MKKCKHFNIFTWGEPPMEEGESGQLVNEDQCRVQKGFNQVTCEGYIDRCNYPINLKLPERVQVIEEDLF